MEDGINDYAGEVLRFQQWCEDKQKSFRIELIKLMRQRMNYQPPPPPTPPGGTIRQLLALRRKQKPRSAEIQP
jgi:hypothetical protein